MKILNNQSGEGDTGCLLLIAIFILFFWGTPDLYDLIYQALETYIRSH